VTVDLPDTAALAALTPLALYALVALLAAVAVGRTTPILRVLPSLVTCAGGITGAVLAVVTLLNSEETTLQGWAITPFASFSLRVDALTAFFLLVISLPAVAISVYGLGYLDADHGGTHELHPPARAATDGLVAAFLAAMSLVVLADGVIPFLLVWELMSLVSFFLVLGNGHNRDNRRAAYIYVVMTQVATGFLIFAFLLLARHASSLDFAEMRAAAASLDHWERDAVFLLALIGFGAKAGLIPLHVWLPRAHPAAPSHVSALMSGVMVKIALYGFIRVVWDLAGPGPGWWGGLLVVVGAVSAVMGILYALMERDLKRVLAYSTIEHVGIIVLAIGSAQLLTAGDYAEAAALALVAALVHLFNHTLFKSLLFLGAGAIQTGAGTRDLERLGGLIRRMPKTAALVLVGSVAIAALPPLNGFAGEWLIFQSLLSLGGADTVPMATIAALAAGALALTSALALACFVRVFGIGFLAQPRTDAARDAREVSRSMLLGMTPLAIGCVVLGLVPTLIFRLLRPVTTDLVGVDAHPQIGGNFNASQMTGSYSPIALVAGMFLLGVLPWLVARLLAGEGRSRIAPTWVCGVGLETRMQYSATGFAKPIRIIFKALIRPQRIVTLDRTSSPYFVRSVRYEETVHAIYERVYERVVHVLVITSTRIRLLQNGSVRTYLTFLFVTLVVALLLAR
jgi:hydrogenase-4 component B